MKKKDREAIAQAYYSIIERRKAADDDKNITAAEIPTGTAHRAATGNAAKVDIIAQTVNRPRWK